MLVQGIGESLVRDHVSTLCESPKDMIIIKSGLIVNIQ